MLPELCFSLLKGPSKVFKPNKQYNLVEFYTYNLDVRSVGSVPDTLAEKGPVLSSLYLGADDSFRTPKSLS